MLDPTYLERAGDLVAAVYSEIEAEMCAHLVAAMLAGDVSDWRSMRAIASLSQGEAARLRAILERHRGDIDAAVLREVEDALGRSDEDDLRRLRRALGVDLPGITTQQVALVARGVAEMLERDNVEMVSGALDALNREVAWALNQNAAGLMGLDEAVAQATRRLAREGIDVIQYRDPTTGAKTVRNRVDVAVRRHVRSQLHQETARRTQMLCEQAGCEFVEVSSHYGARPSHQNWEGRVYHVGGEATVDGVTYADFDEATGYHGTGPHGALGDRLCGVNCRHSFGPWAPGMPRLYHPNPEHPSGRTNDEIYKLTQQQRAMERGIRATKRELAAAQAAYERDPSLRNQVEVNKLRNRLRDQEQSIHDLVAENKDVLTREHNREWAGDMPRVRVPEGSARSMDEYLAQPSVAEQMRKTGASRTATNRELSRLLKANDMTRADFRSMSAADQRGLGDAAIGGAIRGNTGRMNAHAERYYESVRSMDRPTVIRAIAEQSGMAYKEAERAFSHLFLEEHDLGESGTRRFFADYEIAQSTQRILLGRGVCRHDRILFRHELAESALMEQGIAQGEAHDMANLRYNYQEATVEWLKRGAVPGD